MSKRDRAPCRDDNFSNRRVLLADEENRENLSLQPLEAFLWKVIERVAPLDHEMVKSGRPNPPIVTSC
jgi:hypothetical protein